MLRRHIWWLLPLAGAAVAGAIVAAVSLGGGSSPKTAPKTSHARLKPAAAAHSYGASLVGRFAPDDLAVIRVSGAHLTPASFADSSKLEVGNVAIAIGNPLGLRSSVTEGIVSAFRQGVSEGNGVALPSMIQTSAAINPGNSGGALADLQGRVIGIPTLAATDPE